MLRFLHRLSAWMFYPLGLSFFAAYIAVRQDWAAPLARWWLGVLDLPLLICGLLYGAASVVLSISDDDRPSAVTAWSVLLPAVVILLAVLVVNFGLFVTS